VLDAFSVRTQPKDHGTGQRIEGCFAAGFPVVIVEDVLTTGSSAREAISAVQGEGGHVLGVLAVLDREEGGREAIERAGFLVEVFLTASDLGLGLPA
jgi:orotate phosphoribosyltransferase